MFLVYIIISTKAEGIERNSLTNSANQTKTKPTNLNDKYKISTFISRNAISGSINYGLSVKYHINCIANPLLL